MEGGDNNNGTWKYQDGSLTLTVGSESKTYKVENFTVLSMTLVNTGEMLGEKVTSKMVLVKVVD